MLAFALTLLIFGWLLGQTTQKSSWGVLPWLVFLAFGYLAAIVQFPLLITAPYFETDFADYCISLLAFEDPRIPFPPKRSRFAAVLPFVFSQSAGIVNGMAQAAWFSTALLGMGIYFWASQVAGRVAGVFAVCIALTMAPLVSLSRFLNFYPEIVTAFVWGAAFLAYAFRKRTPRSFFLAGIGVGICLLIDSRGLIWALPYGVAGVFGCLTLKGWRSKCLALLCFVIPLYLSWYGGWWAFTSFSSPLEKQIDVRPLFVGFDEDNPALKPPWLYPSKFIWGWSRLSELPRTIEFLWEQKNIAPPQGFLDWQNALRLQDDYFKVWRNFSLSCALAAAAGLCFKPWRFIGFLAALCPFVAAFIGIESMVEQHIRFFTHALPGVAVLGGVAAAQVFRFGCSFNKRYRLPPLCLGACVCILGLSVALGWIPTWMSPETSWRPLWKVSASTLSKIQEKARYDVDFNDNSWEADCARAIQADGQIDLILYPQVSESE